MNKRKQFILFLTLVILISITLLTFYLVFRVTKITVSYQYSGVEIDVNDKEVSEKIEKIKRDSGFSKNELIFFTSKKKAYENIEKNNNDIKVISIEKRFPGTIAIAVYKKKGLYSIKVNDSKYAILDEDLIFLREENKEKENYIKISGNKFSLNSIKEISNKNYSGIYKNLLNLVRSLGKEFNFIGENKNKNIFKNRKKYTNFLKEIKLSKDLEKIILKTRENFRIELDLNIENIDILIERALDIYNTPEFEDYINNQKNQKFENTTKEEYILKFSKDQKDNKLKFKILPYKED